MKKLYLLALAACLATGAQADNVKYLTFKLADGTEKSLPLGSNLSITFANGELMAYSYDDSSSFRAKLSDMESMWFAVEPSAIETILTDDLAAGTPISVYGMDGRLVKSCQHVKGAQPELPAGTYIISAGKKTAKIVVK